ncbi:molybdopterin-dependent oxidoreductase [Chloroflexota bacterium]
MTHLSAGTEIKKSNCVWCKGECGVLVHVKDGRLIGVEPDPDYPRKVWPPTKGCVRRKAAVEYFYHPDRLNFPLKRVGEKGEGKWQRISWEQALDEIADKLKEIINKNGAEAICMSSGTGPRSYAPLVQRFFRVLGTPNTCSQGQICFRPRIIAGCVAVGYHPEMHGLGSKTKCMVFLGVEPLIARPPMAHNFWAAKRNGAKLIVIDPRRTRSAEMADIWIQHRPGTDCAVLMGMINVIIKEDLYDKDFVDKWCYGFDKLRERAEEYTPEKVEAISQVPAETIREAARVYAKNRPGCFVEGMGVEHLPNNAEALHARWILAGLTGNVDIEGGEQLAGQHPKILSPGDISPKVALSQEQLDKQIGADRFKLFSWRGAKILADNSEKAWGKRIMWVNLSQGSLVYRAMITGEPYPVRAMITTASNPMITQANTKLVYKALKSLDLYVVMDFFMTPSAALADYVLPAACWLEVPYLYDKSGTHPGYWFSEAALPSVMPGEYEHKDDYDVFRELAVRLGKGDLMPWKSREEYFDCLCEPTGYTFNEGVHKIRYSLKNLGFKKYEKTGFATPTGKVEFYSTVFEQLGYDPLPKFEEPAETPIGNPELTKEYPLMLITGGRMREYYHSEWRQIESVRKRRPHPTMQIHPDTAAKLGIAKGDWVWIETVRGKVKQKAELFDGLTPDVVHAEHGWWFPELPGEDPWLHGVWESNINVVMDDDPDVCSQITGAWPLKTALCKVYKVKSY